MDNKNNVDEIVSFNTKLARVIMSLEKKRIKAEPKREEKPKSRKTKIA